MTRVGFTVAFVALALASGERRGAGGVQGQTVHDTLTFTKDVAPILYRHCVSCHHPGGWAPFSLLAYEDVVGRARLIAAVTERRTISADNPRNPNHPPQRVVYGSLSSDEMSDLVIQVLPRNRSDLEIPRRDLEWKYEIREVTYVARQEYVTGRELAEQGMYTEAVGHFRAALRLKVDDAEVYIGLAKALTSLGEFDAASAIAERAANSTDYGDPVVLDGLAAVYAASGRANQALRAARQAVALARAAGRDSLANAIRSRLESYGRRNR